MRENHREAQRAAGGEVRLMDHKGEFCRIIGDLAAAPVAVPDEPEESPAAPLPAPVPSPLDGPVGQLMFDF